MGKKRIVKKSGDVNAGAKARITNRVPKKKLDHGVLHVRATYNNTMLHLTDPEGKSVLSTSSGALGFKGSKKGTPFAASKAGELMAEKGLQMGLSEVMVVVKGVGAGRESAIRAFVNKGIGLTSITDRTPVPFNGPRPPKPRRV